MTERRKLISNSFSMLLNRLTQSITTFVLCAAIARLLGAYELGQYLLAFSYYFIFVTIASQGLKTLFTRELAQYPEKTPVYLISGSWLQFLFSLIAYVSLIAVIFVMPYSPDTSTVCNIIGLAIIPFALSNIIEAIFQGQEKMHLIAFSTVPIYIIRLVITLIAINVGYGINSVAIIFVVSEVIILIIEWILVIQFVDPVWVIEKNFVRHTTQKVRTFLAIEGIAAINSRIEIFILSLLGNESLVGFYGGISQLLQPLLIIANSLSTAMFPAMAKAVGMEKEKQQKQAESFIGILMLAALPFLTGILFEGRNLLVFVYNPDFAQATVAFQIAALALIVMPFNRVLSNFLVANDYEKVNLYQVAINTPLAALLGILLIPSFGLIGAAIMDLCSSIIGFSQYIYATYKRLFSLNLWRIFMPSILICMLMIPVFLILGKLSPNFLVTLITSISIYMILIGFWSVYAFGGPRVVYAKLLSKG